MMRRFPLVLSALALTMGLAACGGGSSSDSKSSDSSNSSNNPEKTDYEKLVEQGKKAKFKVTYKTDDGTTWTVIQDPPKTAYIFGDSAFYQDGSGSTVSCSNLNSTPECLKIDGSGADANPTLGLLSSYQELVDTKNLPGTTRVTDRDIAGQAAKCVSYQPPLVGNSSVETCVDKSNGVILLAKSTVSGKTVIGLEATKVEQPKASDFTPPATPKTIDDLLTTTTTM